MSHTITEMCHFCYSTGVELKLIEVKDSVTNPMGTIQIPLCEKCRK